MPHRPNAHLIGSIAFSGMLLGLITLAIGGSEPAVVIWSLVLVAAIVIEFHLLWPGSAFFTVVFANSIGIYACLYTFFASVSFPRVDAQIGFVPPLIVFAAAVAVRHKAIQNIVEAPVHKFESDLRRSLRAEGHQYPRRQGAAGGLRRGSHSGGRIPCRGRYRRFAAIGPPGHRPARLGAAHPDRHHCRRSRGRDCACPLQGLAGDTLRGAATLVGLAGPSTASTPRP